MRTTAGSQPNCHCATLAQRAGPQGLHISVKQLQTAVASPVLSSEWPPLPPSRHGGGVVSPHVKKISCRCMCMPAPTMSPVVKRGP